jgi:hypothetical protein
MRKNILSLLINKNVFFFLIKIRPYAISKNLFFLKNFFEDHVWQNYIFVQNKIVKIGLSMFLSNMPLSQNSFYQNNDKPKTKLSK